MRRFSLVRALTLVVPALLVFSMVPPLPANAAPPGSLDHAFGDGGRVDLDFGQNLPEGGEAFAMQADGKRLVAGDQDGPGGRRMAVARYTANGHFDGSFGNHGH